MLRNSVVERSLTAGEGHSCGVRMMLSVMGSTSPSPPMGSRLRRKVCALTSVIHISACWPATRREFHCGAGILRGVRSAAAPAVLIRLKALRRERCDSLLGMRVPGFLQDIMRFQRALLPAG